MWLEVSCYRLTALGITTLYVFRKKGKNYEKKWFVFASVVLLTAHLGFAEEAPLWDLARDEIPATLQSGAVKKVDGKITLKDGTAFAVPAKAFPDQKNFTVQVTASLSELVNHTLLTVMSKQSEKG